MQWCPARRGLIRAAKNCMTQQLWTIQEPHVDSHIGTAVEESSTNILLEIAREGSCAYQHSRKCTILLGSGSSWTAAGELQKKVTNHLDYREYLKPDRTLT